MQADEADVVLGALLHAAEQICGDELVLAEVLGLVLEAGERVMPAKATIANARHKTPNAPPRRAAIGRLRIEVMGFLSVRGHR